MTTASTDLLSDQSVTTCEAPGKGLRAASRSHGAGPRILVAGRATGMAAPGGGEVQMLATVRALRQRGVDARLWRPWEHRLGDFDALHLFGSHPEHLALAEAARTQGMRVVLSTIAWFDLASRWREPGPWRRRLAGTLGHLTRAAAPGTPSWRRRLYHAADLLLPNSQAEADQLVRYFGVPASRIHVVPNGADPRFAGADPEPFARLVGGRGFVLCPGRVEPRKNQLALVRAIAGLGQRLVVLGSAVPGHERYYEACRRAADADVTFLPRLDHADPLLASAYAASGCLALASWFETPGLVALEAALSGTPLVLPRGGCAREYFGLQAHYVSPDDPGQMRRAIRSALGEGRSPARARLVREHFTWDRTAEITCQAYHRLALNVAETER